MFKPRIATSIAIAAVSLTALTGSPVLSPASAAVSLTDAASTVDYKSLATTKPRRTVGCLSPSGASVAC